MHWFGLNDVTCRHAGVPYGVTGAGRFRDDLHPLNRRAVGTPSFYGAAVHIPAS